jgi:hypothetical protein
MAGESFEIKPTLVDIRCRITAAVAFAEIYIESHPQHAAALRTFCQQLRRSVQNLGEAVYGKPMAK